MFGAVLGNPVAQGARIDPEVSRDLGDRLAGIPDDADRTLPELRIELPPCLWHTYSS
jgi:hypothetical protein